MESMRTIVEVNSLEELAEHLSQFKGIFVKTDVQPEEIRFDYYCYDPRINWETYLVRIRNNIIAGLSDSKFDRCQKTKSGE